MHEEEFVEQVKEELSKLQKRFVDGFKSIDGKIESIEGSLDNLIEICKRNNEKLDEWNEELKQSLNDK